MRPQVEAALIDACFFFSMPGEVDGGHPVYFRGFRRRMDHVMSIPDTGIRASFLPSVASFEKLLLQLYAGEHLHHRRSRRSDPPLGSFGQKCPFLLFTADAFEAVVQTVARLISIPFSAPDRRSSPPRVTPLQDASSPAGAKPSRPQVRLAGELG